MNKCLSCVGALLLIAIAFLTINTVCDESLVGVRLDLTQQQLFTLSPGTRKLLATLEEPVNLYFVYSDKDIHTPAVRQYASHVKNLLETYERESAGWITLHVIDPQPLSKNAEYAARLGLQAVNLSPGSEPVYFGLAGSTPRGDVQIIPFLTQDDEATLEYELSRMVEQLALPKRPVLGLMAGLPIEGGFDASSEKTLAPWALRETLGRQYEVKDVPTNAEQIPQEVQVLMIVHPQKLPTLTLYAIDQFILHGGKLLAFMDPYSELDPGATYFGVPSLDRSSGMDLLLEAWGVRILPGKVLGDAYYAMVASRDPRETVRLPIALGLPDEALNQQDITTAGLANINLTTAGVLQPINGAKTTFTALMHSSAHSMLFDARRFSQLVAPGELMSEFKPGEGPHQVLAARIQGPVTSAFPEGVAGHLDGKKTAADVNLILVADTDLLTDRMWVRGQSFHGRQALHPWADNGNFVLNALDDLLGRDELISVRSRGRSSHPFTRVEHLQQQLWGLPNQAQLNDAVEELGNRLKWINMMLVPLILSALALLYCTGCCVYRRFSLK